MSANACAVCVNGYMRSGGPRGRLMTCWCCHGYRHAGEGYVCPNAPAETTTRDCPHRDWVNGYRNSQDGSFELARHEHIRTHHAADREEESARMPRGHRIGDQRVEDLPAREELGE